LVTLLCYTDIDGTQSFYLNLNDTMDQPTICNPSWVYPLLLVGDILRPYCGATPTLRNAESKYLLNLLDLFPKLKSKVSIFTIKIQAPKTTTMQSGLQPSYASTHSRCHILIAVDPTTPMFATIAEAVVLTITKGALHLPLPPRLFPRVGLWSDCNAILARLQLWLRLPRARAVLKPKYAHHSRPGQPHHEDH
jgi:hypothetical protein